MTTGAGQGKNGPVRRGGSQDSVGEHSIENYLVCREKDEFDLAGVLTEFDKQLNRFHRAMLVLMAWIVAVRRSGQRPNLNNIELSEYLVFSDVGIARGKKSDRLASLAKSTGIKTGAAGWKQVLLTCAELKRLDPKRYVRGKFEAWFFLEFIKRVIGELDTLARQSGGSISVTGQLYQSNFVQMLVQSSQIPTSLESFLNFHFSKTRDLPTTGPGVIRRAWNHIVKRF